MSIVAIRAAFESALNNMTPVVQTAWENVEFSPPDNRTPYQRADLMLATPDNPEMSSGYRELGYLQIMLLYPLLVGTADAAARAILLRSTFPKNLSLTSSGVVVTVNGTPAIGNGTTDGDRWNLPVKIPFFANFF